MSLKHIATQVAECQGCVFNIGICHLDATLYRAVSHLGACVDGIFVCSTPGVRDKLRRLRVVLARCTAARRNRDTYRRSVRLEVLNR